MPKKRVHFEVQPRTPTQIKVKDVDGKWWIIAIDATITGITQDGLGDDSKPKFDFSLRWISDVFPLDESDEGKPKPS